jgi:hypothetical protein
MSSVLDGLWGFVERAAATDTTDCSLLVVNRTEPAPVMDLFGEAFERQSVDVVEATTDDAAEDVVLLVEDGEVVATSSLQSLMRAFLMVNVDLYRTGTSGIDKHEPPAVLTGLDDTVFTLRGYPQSAKEKLLLVLVSRYIERRALAADAGRLRSAFQRLSRIDDELGTRRVYERLSETAVDVHLYGVPDRTPPTSIDATVHDGRGPGYRRSWFVVFSSPEDSAALVALRRGDEWWGTWTHDPDRVAAVDALIEREL